MKDFTLPVDELLSLPIGTELYDGEINSKTLLVSIDRKKGTITTKAIGATVPAEHSLEYSIEWLLTAPIDVSNSLKDINFSRGRDGLPSITQEEVWTTSEEYPAYLFLQQISKAKDSDGN